MRSQNTQPDRSFAKWVRVILVAALIVGAGTSIIGPRESRPRRSRAAVRPTPAWQRPRESAQPVVHSIREASLGSSAVHTPAKSPSISGTIVDVAGQPVAHARLFLYWDPSIFGSPVTGRSSLSGEFNLTLPIENATRISLRVAHPQFKAVSVEISEPELPCRIELRPGLRVSGRVVFLDGHPVPGVAVGAYQSVLDAAWRMVATDADGHYTLGGFAPGEVLVTCSASMNSPTRAAVPQSVDAGATAKPFVLRQSVVAIRVRDHQDSPVPRAQCIGAFGDSQFEGTTDESGVLAVLAQPGSIGWIRTTDPRRRHAPSFKRVTLRSAEPSRQTIEVPLAKLVSAGCWITVRPAAGGVLPSTVGHLELLGVNGGVLDERQFPLNCDFFMNGIPADILRLRVYAGSKSISDTRRVQLSVGDQNHAVFNLPSHGTLSVAWEPRSLRGQLRLRRADGRALATRFEQLKPTNRWKTTHPVAAGAYELVECVGETVIRSVQVLVRAGSSSSASFLD